MVEDILKKDGLSFTLLRKLSFRSRLGADLCETGSFFEKNILFDEISKMISWYDTHPVLASLPADYRIKSFCHIQEKYQQAGEEYPVEKIFNDVLSFQALCNNYEEIFRLRESGNISIADFSNGKLRDNGYRGVRIYYQYGHRHYPVEIQYHTYYDRQMNNWLYKYVLKENYPDYIGARMRREYEAGRIRTECECEEVLRGVLSDCQN